MDCHTCQEVHKMTYLVPSYSGYAGNTSRQHKEFALPLSVFVLMTETPETHKIYFVRFRG